ncbi:phospho-sugar mutase [Demequina sp. TTPB684]|uniref:phospho-sugar mutase n=1 Tax=unclassified Demequina TaxID=2620311 RepID=UPI001CF399F9|nr:MULTISPECIES: phospho-sugar mutase [unclassified Demequina]MCB2411587.1 phospho-sugar mutase [Demequina sp. TTPB684]UPU87258.1 phospho-sugar mutase [Demequina sp. TMPB413]
MDVSDIDDAAVAATTWLKDDPDPATRAELTQVLEAVAAGDADAAADLADRMSGLLQFGTAGLRGRLGAGPNRMNRAVVIRAASGLCSYVTAQLGHPGTVVVGYDARHGSAEFAHDTAAVAVAAGHRALLLPSPLPTPVLAYAIKALGADAGVMVTASHNPAWDNGYKVYLGASITPEAPGAQIVPPHDAGIAKLIEAVDAVAGVQRATSGWEVLSPSVVDDYAAKVAALVPAPQGDVATRRTELKVVLTPIHGVGDATVRQALGLAGFTDLTSVPEQAQPDPDFPTVAFPNPEEPGAIDLALKLATTIDADVVIANDPDTDRCAVATVIDGDWRMLHGDVVGSLLGERVAAAHAGQPQATLANSIVSSQQLAAIAKRHGLAHANTLTGFKWISRAPQLLYGYEEALGYCVAPELVLDKDGVSTAVLMAEMVSELKASGRTLADAIDDLARQYGVYLSSQVSARFDDVSQIPALMKKLLASPPEQLAGSPVTGTDDMNQGFAGLPPTNGLHLAAESGARVIIRPSGTEPKVKAYLEVIEVVDAGDVRSARGRAADAMAALRKDVEALLGA